VVSVEVSAEQVFDPLQDVLSRHDPGDEQQELAAHAQVHAGALPPQPLGEPAGLGEVVEDLPLRHVAERGLQPHVQPTLGGLGGRGGEPVDAVAGDLDGVGVQVVPPMAAVIRRKRARLIPIDMTSVSGWVTRATSAGGLSTATKV